jgi:hypothetical protein
MENNDFDDEYENDFDLKHFSASIWFTGNGFGCYLLDYWRLYI